MKFNSQICTSREQSERLIALGLKKETADMCWIEEWGWDDDKQETFCTGNYFVRPIDYVWDDKYINYIPAWSLHRLIEMVAGGSEEQMIFLPDPYDELIEEIAGAIIVGCFPKEYLV